MKWLTVAGCAIALLATAAAGNCAPSAFVQTPSIATLSRVDGGRDAVRSMTARFRPEMLPATASSFQPGSYYLAAALPDGRLFSYTRGGWVAADLGSLRPFASAPALISGLTTEQFVSRMDLSGLAGTLLYGGIEVGSTLYWSYLGYVVLPRAVRAVSFPFRAGNWTVYRFVDDFTDVPSCSAFGSTPGQLSPTLLIFNTGPNTAINWTVTIVGLSLDTNRAQSQLRFNGQMPFTVAQWATANAGANHFNAQGRPILYGNFEPSLSSGLGGGSAAIRYVSPSGGVVESGTVDLSRFGEVVDAFDHCVGTL